MSTLEPHRRRSLDGPARRLPENPLATQPIAPIAPAPAAVTEPDTPIFEYHKPRRRVRRGILRFARPVAIGVIVVVLGMGAWFGWKAFNAARNIIGKTNGGAPALAGALDPTKLKGEGDGRVNILVLGIGGAGHEGPNLSDTIMVWSFDPHTKDVAALSIPRDLYVKIPGRGYGKINGAHAYGGPALTKKVVSEVIGVPLHYYAVVDFAGFKQAVDAVGGVDVTVDEALYDPSFPCDRGAGYCAFSIKAGRQHMNGTVALRYARSRKTTSDFDRAARQQKVIVALRQKAMELSTLTNPVKLTQLIDAIGGHFKTDLQIGEMRKLALLAKDINPDKIVQKVLDTSGPDSLLVDGSGRISGAGSIELPRAGNFDYSDIRDFVKNIFADHYITDEKARIEVQNGSGQSGVAATVVKSLKAAHYNVGDPLNAPQQLTQTVIYDYTGGKKPYTINYLERRFGVKARRAATPSPSIDATGKSVPAPEIRIILGSDYKPSRTPQ